MEIMDSTRTTLYHWVLCADYDCEGSTATATVSQWSCAEGKRKYRLSSLAERVEKVTCVKTAKLQYLFFKVRTASVEHLLVALTHKKKKQKQPQHRLHHWGLLTLSSTKCLVDTLSPCPHICRSRKYKHSWALSEWKTNERRWNGIKTGWHSNPGESNTNEILRREH